MFSSYTVSISFFAVQCSLYLYIIVYVLFIHRPNTYKIIDNTVFARYHKIHELCRPLRPYRLMIQHRILYRKYSYRLQNNDT